MLYLFQARVQRLKRELANINSEMDYRAKGVETLARYSHTTVLRSRSRIKYKKNKK
jgi:hypothetical protein